MKAANEKTLVGMAIVGAVCILAAVYAVLTVIPPAVSRVTAILGLAAIPLAYWIGWRIGTKESRAHLSGVEQGVGAVMNAAQKTADIRRGQMARAVQGRSVPASQAGGAVPLPDPQIVTARFSDDEVVDL